MENQAELQVLDTSISIYNNASLLIIEKEEQDELLAPFNEELIEIRPDGLIFLPQTFWRQRLNETFGIGQWCLVIKGQHKDPDPQKDKLYLQGVLMVRGSYVAEAVGEAELHSNNNQQSWASVWESAKSDCITRCCKDLSIASELWQPQFINAWKNKFAVDVWCEIKQRDGSVRPKKQWRKKDAQPFWNEKKNNQPTQTTAYNNKELSKDGKPLITNEAFKKLMERLNGGEVEVYDKAINGFLFTDEQQRLLDGAFEIQNLSDEDIDNWQSVINEVKTIEDLRKLKTKHSPFITQNFKTFTMLSKRKSELEAQTQTA